MAEHAQHWWVVDTGRARLEHNPSCPYLAYHDGMFDPAPTVRAHVCEVAVAHADGHLKVPRHLTAGRWHIQRSRFGWYFVSRMQLHQAQRVLRGVL
jgi:hypothetical protein